MKRIFFGIAVFWAAVLQAQVTVETLALAYLKHNAPAPEAYVLAKFDQYDIVLLGERHGIRDNLEFVCSLIPALYERGVRQVGMEFGAAEMQSIADSVVIAPQYAAQVVRDMLFYYNAGWAYQEYQSVYEAVWRFNQSLPKGAPPFRVLHLSYRFDWQHFSAPRTAAVMEKVFVKGTVDGFRAGVVAREVLDKSEKALLLVGEPHAFTRYANAVFSFNHDGFCTYDDQWLGNRLYRQFPGKVTNIFLHAPFFNQPGKKPYQLCPGNGAIERIMMQNDWKSVGFDLVNTPFGQLPDSSNWQTGYKNFTLGQFFDGYLFLKPFHQLRGCTFDPHFFEGKTWAMVQANLPDPDWQPAGQTFESYQQQIRNYTDLRTAFKDAMIPEPIPAPATGRIERLTNFSSQYLSGRRLIDVWLPPQYDPKNRYPVLYMHDGQMLFDSTITWNRQEWGVDETLERLFRTGAMKPCIVVGIHNGGSLRHAEYFPEKAWNMLGATEQERVFSSMRQSGIPVFGDTVQSDRYLKFLVEELKPRIDSQYATLPDRAHTWIAGSSMGGLISMYAICEYPAVFGRAACLSTHWPGIFTTENNPVPGAFQAYLRKYLPPPGSHKIYFDYGTATLDALYEPYQKAVDAIMRDKGYSNRYWVSRKFEGADHSEKAWRERLEIPLLFMGKK